VAKFHPFHKYYRILPIKSCVKIWAFGVLSGRGASPSFGVLSGGRSYELFMNDISDFSQFSFVDLFPEEGLICSKDYLTLRALIFAGFLPVKHLINDNGSARLFFPANQGTYDTLKQRAEGKLIIPDIKKLEKAESFLKTLIKRMKEGVEQNVR
jgi:hypothetical protein